MCKGNLAPYHYRLCAPIVHPQGPEWDTALSMTNVVFTVIFIVEMVLKWMAIGLKQYFKASGGQGQGQSGRSLGKSQPGWQEGPCHVLVTLSMRVTSRLDVPAFPASWGPHTRLMPRTNTLLVHAGRMVHFRFHRGGRQHSGEA